MKGSDRNSSTDVLVTSDLTLEAYLKTKICLVTQCWKILFSKAIIICKNCLYNLKSILFWKRFVENRGKLTLLLFTPLDGLAHLQERTVLLSWCFHQLPLCSAAIAIPTRSVMNHKLCQLPPDDTLLHALSASTGSHHSWKRPPNFYVSFVFNSQKKVFEVNRPFHRFSPWHHYCYNHFPSEKISMACNMCSC